MKIKKFILKPGNHQFVPGSHPIHNNDNLDDDEAEWYLREYPHIANLFEKTPSDEELKEIKINRELALVNILPNNSSNNKKVKKSLLQPDNEQAK